MVFFVRRNSKIYDSSVSLTQEHQNIYSPTDNVGRDTIGNALFEQIKEMEVQKINLL